MWSKLSGSILGKISLCGLQAIKPWEFPRPPWNSLFLRGNIEPLSSPKGPGKAIKDHWFPTAGHLGLYFSQWGNKFKLTTQCKGKKETLNDVFPEMLMNMLISFEQLLKTFDLNTFKSLKSFFSGIARFSTFEFFIHRN